MSAAQMAVFAWLLLLPQTAQRVNPDAQTQKEFTDRVTKYVELRKSVESKLPSLPDKAEPAEITRHQQALLKSMQRARSDARAGDLFQEKTRHLIRRLVAGATEDHRAARRAIRDENPGQLRVRVNGAFPTTVPLPTVPPQVLLALPRLPDEGLEYRFVGTRLLLLDTQANMVVDYMDHALPK